MRRFTAETDGREFDDIFEGEDGAAAIIHNIASFMTLSDAAGSCAERGGMLESVSPTDSWAIGGELDAEIWSVATPATPALVALSPGATPHLNEYHVDIDKTIEELEDDDSFMEGLLHERRRAWAQEKLASAVLSHQRSLRSFCLEAYSAAQEIRMLHERKEYIDSVLAPETLIEPSGLAMRKRKRPRKNSHQKLVRAFMKMIMKNVPLSVLIDVIEAVGDTSLNAASAAFRISVRSVSSLIATLGRITHVIWEAITNFNPFHLLEAIISLQFNAMGRTSEVLVSGIQSVATGVGSASNIALHRLSAANLSGHRTVSSSSLRGDGNLRSIRGAGSAEMNKELLIKLSELNSAALVINYTETGDDTGGLTKHAKHRVQRMMHYNVSLRPFVATVEKSLPRVKGNGLPAQPQCLTYLGSADSTAKSISPPELSTSPSEVSPFMCTPQSFPPTPHSRRMEIEKRTRMSDDVVFLARDRLRVQDGLHSDDERTREMARALNEGKRLAIFDCRDTSNGIGLTCGRHIATKIGNMLYASTRSMVPALRNCYVYFELTVLPHPGGTVPTQASMATLSIGVATEEMPPNTLVGAWHGSVGLCSTGQILCAGQWCSSVDPSQSSYGDNAIVGCLVYLDDDSAFETWDGVMVTASVTFNVNGQLVSQPISCLPMPAPTAALPTLPQRIKGEQVAMADDFRSASQRSGFEVAPTSPTLPLLVPAAEELYPTVTLHSPATSVMCHFSAEDLIAQSRDSIGAPPHAAVYAIDGSIIFSDLE